MKPIKADLPRELQKIEIHTFSDEHIGTTYSDTANIKQRIKDGIDLMYFLCAEFGLQDRYHQYGVLLFVRFGAQSRGKKETNNSGNVRKMCYTIYATHGSVGGRTAGVKANGLQRLGGIINSDVCLISHSHFPMCFKECSFEIDYPNSAYRKKETTYVNSGSALDWGGYSERYSFKPSSKAHTIIILDGRRHNVEVVL